MARSGVIFGPTGVYKTTAVAHFSQWIAETTGKATLLLSADGGGWDPCQEEVLAGMIRPHKVNPEISPLAVIRRVSQGYWPENPDEPLGPENGLLPVNWDEVGGIAVEGITSLGTMLMRHCADRDLKTGESGTSPVLQPVGLTQPDGRVTIVQERFTQNSRGHFGFVQNQLYSLVMNFISLPVSYVLFTAHEKRYTEDGEVQCGIAAPGKAITPLIPTWLGDCIHAHDWARDQQTVKVPDGKGGLMDEMVTRVIPRYYFKKHIDTATGMLFDAKPRVTHSKALELEKVFPGGFFIPTPEAGFNLYLEAVDKLAKDAAQSDKMRDWRAKMDKRLGRASATAVASATVSK